MDSLSFSPFLSPRHQLEAQAQIIASLTAQLTDSGKDIRERDNKIVHQNARIDYLSQRVEQLEHMIRQANDRQFGVSSEQLPEQGRLFDEAEAEAAIEEAADTEADQIEVPAHTRQKTRKPAIPDNLPVVRVEHDLDEQEKACACCGGERHRIGEDSSRQLDIVPARAQVIEHVRFKYACRHCDDAGVETARAPIQPIPGSIASPGTLAWVVTSKYCDGLPLYRLSSILERGQLDISRATLSHWVIRAAELITPYYQLLHRKLVAQSVLHADETRLQVLSEPGKPATSKSYMWAYRTGIHSSHPMVLMDYQPGRGFEYPERFLKGFRGYLHTDGYAVYDKLPDVRRVACWAHARRKFHEANKLLPKAGQRKGSAFYALNEIQKLYGVEKALAGKPLPERQQIREEKARPVLDKFHDWLCRQQSRHLPKSPLGRAINYCLDQWPALMRYLEQGDLAIDNNVIERDIRPFAIGRKNWLFSQSQNGARSSAMLYSLALTARANALDPYQYFRKLFTELPNTPYEDWEQLMPWMLAEGQMG
jgi:transposase